MSGMGERDGADADLRPDQLLGLAVERAYVTYAGNRLGRSMVVRRRDVSPAEVAALAGPIRTVTAAAIDRWLPHAVTTWGTAEDLRALLPRLFELFTAGLLDTSPEVLFAKLRHADAPGWPTAERAALDALTSASWRAGLARHPSPMGPAGRLLIALAELGREISPYLDDWSQLLGAGGPEADSARRHLTDLARRADGLRASRPTLDDLFWSARPTESARLEIWLSSPLIRGNLPEPLEP